MKGEIVRLVIKALKKHGVELSVEDVGNLIEIPPKSEMGDYAFPCFFLSKKLRKNPHEIANELMKDIGKNGFERVVANGAYINFFIGKDNFSKSLVEKILKQKEKFGKDNIGGGKKILIEHTSINPNASPHVGRARNAIIGDSLVKIHEFLGFRPEVHYYINDVSKQIAMLVLANADKLKFEKMLKKYSEVAKKVSSSRVLEKKVFEILARFEKGDRKTVNKFNRITKTALDGQRKILSSLGIHYGFFDYESSYLEKARKVLSQLEKTGKLFLDNHNRYVLNMKGTSVENKMKVPLLVLTRKDGTGLYPLRDIAYTIEKMKKSNENIVVLGEDQKLYFDQLSIALAFLKQKSPKAVHYSFILISSKGKSRKMSTRKGDLVLLEDFFREALEKARKKSKNARVAEKVGIAAVKYTILKNHPNKSINFNLEESLNFEGDTGPYLLYSYARANSITKKSKGRKNKGKNSGNVGDREFELLKKLSQFPEAVLSAYETLNPSLIANYSYHLCQLFNEFYHGSRVLGSENEKFMLEIVECFKTVLKNSLSLLGISVSDKM